MKYSVNKEFGLYAHFRVPLCRALLPAVNFILPRLPAGEYPRGEVELCKLAIPVDGTEIAALLYSPAGAAKELPGLVYFHGGGFVMAAAASHRTIAAAYALRANCRVLVAEYRLAPRHRFPRPFADCYAAYAWALGNAESLKIDPARIALAGDSAGGCLAAAVCLAARDAGAAMPAAQLLVYPVLDRRMQTETMRLYSDTPMWNSRLNRKMWRWYLPKSRVDTDIAYASPAEADSLKGLPSTYIETAEFDCLRGEGEAFAGRLADAGVAVSFESTRGTMHGFDTATSSPSARACIERRCSFLRQAFANKRGM